MGPVLFTLSMSTWITLMKVTNYAEPGKTAHKRGTNKNNLVPSEVRSSKLVRPRIVMKQELSLYLQKNHNILKVKKKLEK